MNDKQKAAQLKNEINNKLVELIDSLPDGFKLKISDRPPEKYEMIGKDKPIITKRVIELEIYKETKTVEFL